MQLPPHVAGLQGQAPALVVFSGLAKAMEVILAWVFGATTAQFVDDYPEATTLIEDIRAGRPTAGPSEFLLGEFRERWVNL